MVSEPQNPLNVKFKNSDWIGSRKKTTPAQKTHRARKMTSEPQNPLNVDFKNSDWIGSRKRATPAHRGK